MAEPRTKESGNPEWDAFKDEQARIEAAGYAFDPDWIKEHILKETSEKIRRFEELVEAAREVKGYWPTGPSSIPASALARLADAVQAYDEMLVLEARPE